MMLRTFISGGALLLSAGLAVADTEACLSIADDTERLACFDAALGYDGGTVAEVEAEEPPNPEDTGAWNVVSETSKMDDSTNVFLTLRTDEQTNCPYKSGAHTLMIACRENTTALWVSFGGCFMSSIQGKGRVTYRLDSETAQQARFRESNDNSALGLWNGGASIPFIKKLLGHERLLLRATPFSDSTVTGEYSIQGLDTAIAPLRAACNW